MVSAMERPKSYRRLSLEQPFQQALRNRVTNQCSRVGRTRLFQQVLPVDLNGTATDPYQGSTTTQNKAICLSTGSNRRNTHMRVDRISTKGINAERESNGRWKVLTLRSEAAFFQLLSTTGVYLP